MNLFDPERPKTSNDRPLMVDGRHIVPMVYVFPMPKGFALQVMVYANDSRGGYVYRHCDVASAEALAVFFEMYRKDPEETLVEYFSWEPVLLMVPDEPDEPNDPDTTSGLDLI